MTVSVTARMEQSQEMTPHTDDSLLQCLLALCRFHGVASTAEALTTYGIIGIKVWIFKGEVIGQAQEAAAPQQAG